MSLWLGSDTETSNWVHLLLTVCGLGKSDWFHSYTCQSFLFFLHMHELRREWSQRLSVVTKCFSVVKKRIKSEKGCCLQKNKQTVDFFQKTEEFTYLLMHFILKAQVKSRYNHFPTLPELHFLQPYYTDIKRPHTPAAQDSVLYPHFVKATKSSAFSTLRDFQ